MAFSAQSPDLQHLSFGRESFAVIGPLALPGNACYPVSVRRLADSLAASFSRPLALAALRFTWVATTSFPGDFHSQVIAHAGHTCKAAARLQAAVVFTIRARARARERARPFFSSRARSRLRSQSRFPVYSGFFGSTCAVPTFGFVWRSFVLTGMQSRTRSATF